MSKHRQRRISLTRGNLLVWTLPTVGVAVTAVVLWLGFGTLAADKEARIRAAAVETEHSAALFKQHARDVIEKADRLTRLVRFEYSSHGGIDLGELERFGLKERGGPFSISIVDARGDIIAGNRPGDPTNIAGHQVLRMHAGRDQDSIEIGQPFNDAATGGDQIQLSRRLNHANGSFAGIVTASIPTSHFTASFKGGELGVRGSLAILGVDGALRVRSAARTEKAVDAVSTAVLLARAKSSGAGTFEETNSGDGTTHIVAYEAMGDYPLIVAASRSKDEVLAGFARYRNDFLLPRLILAVVFLTLVTIATILVMRLQRHRGELRQQRYFLEKLVDNIPSGIAVRSMRESDFGQYVLWNESSSLMIGTTSADTLGRKVSDVMSPEYARKVEELDRQMLADPMLQDAVQVHEQPDGRKMIFNIIRAPILGGDGSVEYIVTSATDITSERRHTEQLELASKVFETTAEGIILSDADDRVLMVNAAFTRLTGFSTDEIVGKLLPDAPFRPTDPSAFEARMERLRRDGSLASEVTRLRKDGTPLSLWISASVVRNSDGSIRNYVRVFTDISLLKKTQLQLEHLASFDTLTGLPNRRLLLDRLEQATRRAQRSDDGLAVMFIDLDDFKKINDSLGHDAGDLLLQEVAQRLQECIRSGDSLGRLGGDEFAIVLEKAAGTAIVTHVGERILSALAAPFDIGGHRMAVGASIGIATYPTDGADGTQLLKSADQAMYSAKHAGRNRFRFSSRISDVATTNDRPEST